MTVPGLTLTSLRAAKNSAIGNPIAKVQLVRDGVFISQLIHSLNANTDDTNLTNSRTAQDMLRIEAAHVIASLSYGSEEALAALLRGNAHHALLYALSHFSSTDSAALRTAFSRALRALTSSLADVAGPSLWGLRPEAGAVRGVAQQALESLFQVETMDVYLPLLAPSLSTYTISTGVLTCTAQMLARTVRMQSHRRAISEWLPPADRQKEIKTRRGWEKTATLNGTTSSPWVARQLVALFGSKDDKLTEAVLLALAALTKENASVANYLEKSLPEAPAPLAWILECTKSRSTDVQIAACLCITHTLRATFQHGPHLHISLLGHASLSSTGQPYSSLHGIPHSSNMSLQDSCTRTVMNVVNRLVGTPPLPDISVASAMSADSPQLKTKACFVLHYLVTDNAPLCNSAFSRGCLEHIGSLIKSITPLEPAIPEWEEDEPESIAQLREAALTCLASLALWSDDVRRRITDELRLLPCISRALRAKHVGTRYAACQCVRAVSRAVSVLRTGIVDSGLGMDVLRIVLGKELGDRFGGSVSSSSSGSRARNVRGPASKDGKCKEISRGRAEDAMDGVHGGLKQPKLAEDGRVLSAALSAVCNIVNDFSPLRPIYLEEKLMPRLVYILRESGDPSLRLNALWAVKNLVRKTSTETKRDLMSHLGWQELLSYLSDPETDIQEQGFNILRNLAENDEGIAMVFRELPQVLGKLVEGMRSSSDDVVLQSTSALANLANGTPEHQDLIIKYPQLLSTLQICLAESTAAVRRPAVSCVLALAKANPRRRKEMAETGIVSTLRRLSEWSGHAPGHPHGGHHGHGHSASIAGAGGIGAPSGGPSGWGGRSPTVRSPTTSSGASAAASNMGAVYGSWAGSGLHHHYSFARHEHAGGAAISADGHGHAAAATGHHTQPHSIGLDDDRDVVQRARNALDWLEHGETYVI